MTSMAITASDHDEGREHADLQARRTPPCSRISRRLPSEPHHAGRVMCHAPSVATMRPTNSILTAKGAM